MFGQIRSGAGNRRPATAPRASSGARRLASSTLHTCFFLFMFGSVVIYDCLLDCLYSDLKYLDYPTYTFLFACNVIIKNE
jgi:hypothetical protein